MARHTVDTIYVGPYNGVVRVVAHPRFAAWYRTLQDDESPHGRTVAAAVNVSINYLARTTLEELHRARAAQISSSRHDPKMWELRHAAQNEGVREINLRILVVVDAGVGVVLLAGDKTGNWREWYEMAIPTADALYDNYLRRQHQP
jgi:hypothetical protein